DTAEFSWTLWSSRSDRGNNALHQKGEPDTGDASADQAHRRRSATQQHARDVHRGQRDCALDDGEPEEIRGERRALRAVDRFTERVAVHEAGGDEERHGGEGRQRRIAYHRDAETD